jgi:hypothetical protein
MSQEPYPSLENIDQAEAVLRVVRKLRHYYGRQNDERLDGIIDLLLKENADLWPDS